MSTRDDDAGRPRTEYDDVRPAGEHATTPTRTATDEATTTGEPADLVEPVVVEETTERRGSGAAGPGLSVAGTIASLLALFSVLSTSTVRECVPQPTGALGAQGVEGYLTALVLAVIGILLSAVGMVASRRGARWGSAVGVSGVVVGVVTIVLWLLAVWVFSAGSIDLSTLTNQQDALPLQGIGCA